MRLNFRTVLNVLVVALVGGAALIWAIVGLANVNLFGPDPATVRAMLPTAAGALPGAEVTYLGQPIGTVTSSEIGPDGVLVSMSVDLPDEVAATLRADVRQKSALGEPYVDLGPSDDAAVVPLASRSDHDGTTIPIERTSVPAGLGQLLTDANSLLADVDPVSLGTVVDGAATALAGREDTIGSILQNTAVIAETITAREAELESILGNTARLTETLDGASGDIESAFDSFAQLSGVLAGRTAELESILQQGSTLANEGSQLLVDVEEDIDGVLAGLDTTFSVLADRPGKVEEILELTPLMIDRFGRTFEGGNFWLSAGGGVPFASAYNPRLGIPVYGTGLRIDRVFTPTIAQRIEVDLAEAGVSDFGFIQLLPDDQIGPAAQEPGGLAGLIDAVGEQLRSGEPAGG